MAGAVWLWLWSGWGDGADCQGGCGGMLWLVAVAVGKAVGGWLWLSLWSYWWLWLWRCWGGCGCGCGGTCGAAMDVAVTLEGPCVQHPSDNHALGDPTTLRPLSFKLASLRLSSSSAGSMMGKISLLQVRSSRSSALPIDDCTKPRRPTTLIYRMPFLSCSTPAHESTL